MDKIVKDLDFLINLAHNRSGIIFSVEQSYSFLAKLHPLIQKYKFQDINQLIKIIKENIDPDLIEEVIESLTNNETSFFRDKYPFEILTELIIPEISKRKTSRPINILSAACASGQEPYSIAISLIENNQINGTKIFAMDICEKTIERAKAGIYNQFEVQRGLQIKYLLKYFDQVEHNWKIKDFIKEKIKFSHFNLQAKLYLNKLDIVFCRNILIYFDQPTRIKVIKNIIEAMDPEAFIVLGSSESIPHEIKNLEEFSTHSGIYKLKS